MYIHTHSCERKIHIFQTNILGWIQTLGSWKGSGNSRAEMLFVIFLVWSIFIWRSWNVRDQEYMVCLAVNVELSLRFSFPHVLSSTFIFVARRGELQYFLPCGRTGKFLLLFFIADKTCCRPLHLLSSRGRHKHNSVFIPASLSSYCLYRERALTEHTSLANLASLCHLLLPISWP